MCRIATIGLATILLALATVNGAPPRPVQRATFAMPYAYPNETAYALQCGERPFRWGWFGADHYLPAPEMHRDYTRGWREWSYQR